MGDAERITVLEKQLQEQQEAIAWIVHVMFYGSSDGRPDIIREILSRERAADPR